MTTILIFAAGDPVGREILDDIPAASLTIAADGGYDIAVALGQPVDVVIGDMDSISRELPRNVAVERHSPDKDRTDLDLAMGLAAGEDPERVIIVGGAGGRQDHELAAMMLIADERWRSIEEIDWLTDRGRLHVIRGRRLIHGDIGTTVSLIAATGEVFGVTTRGLRWNLDNEDLAPGATRGVSNVMTAPVADIKVNMGTLLFVVPSVQP